MPSLKIHIFLAALILGTPFFVGAQTFTPVNVEGTSTSTVDDRIEGASRGFLRDGIFGCAAGQYGMPVGTLQAIRGVYVPVNDAAVTANTGYLVYKECVLDGVIVRMREAASGAVVKNVLNWANTGRNGQPAFITSPKDAFQPYLDRQALEFTKDYNLTNACTIYKQEIKKALLQNYYNATRNSNSEFSCSLGISDAQLGACLSTGGTIASCGGLQGLFDIAMSPGALPLVAYTNTKGAFDEQIGLVQEQLFREAIWNNGYLSADTFTTSPAATGEQRSVRQVQTPGYLISQLVTQAAGSGFRQLENANEIDQIVNSLFSGITQQILTGSGGLRGLSQSVLGKPPYLDQLAAEASAGVRTAAANAALTLLNSSITSERAFNTAKRESKSEVEQAAAQLKAAEDRCFELLIPKVREYARTAACSSDGEDTTCDDPKDLAISTSTPIIEGGLVALALSQGGSVSQGSVYTLTTAASSILQSGQVQFTGASTTQFTASTSIGLTLGSAAAPTAGGNASITIQAKTPFGSGTFSFTLKSGQNLPVGELRLPLLTLAPFSQAAVSLTVGAQRQFSDVVIASQITPLLGTIENGISSSDQALTRLLQLVNSINNTASQTAQRLALEEFDRIVESGILHTEYDVKSAQAQRDGMAAQMDTLVEDTVNDWGSGGGWCNSENEAVVRMWYDRWKVN